MKLMQKIGASLLGGVVGWMLIPIILWLVIGVFWIILGGTDFLKEGALASLVQLPIPGTKMPIDLAIARLFMLAFSVLGFIAGAKSVK